MSLPTVAVIRNSSLVTDDDVKKAVAAIKHQINIDLAPIWNADADVVFFDSSNEVPEDAWLIAVEDTCDVDGALGYHEDASVPSGIIGVKTSTDDGVAWSSVLSHEVCELVVDPYAQACFQVGGQVYALEVCDPVEGAGYEVDGVLLENFIYPSWYVPHSAGKWDHLGVLRGPLELAPGGYYSSAAISGWTQINTEATRPYKRTVAAASRRAKRSRMGRG